MSQLDSEDFVLSEDKGAQEEKLVPVSEAIRYRKRAQAAEKKLATLEEELAESESQRQQFADKVSRVEMEQKLVAKLTSAGANDIEAAVLLVRERIKADEETDLDTVVEGLKREKEYLFSDSKVGFQISKTAGLKQKGANSQNVLERAAKKAATSGNRTDLQEYLKLRRNFV